MALLRQKEAEVALYIAPREYMVAPLNFDDDWTEVRCGVFVSGCTANNESVNASDEQVGSPAESPADGIFFGLKNSDSASLPGEAGSIYLGVKPTGGFPFGPYCSWVAFTTGSITEIGDQVSRMSACGYDGTDLVDGGIIVSATSPNGSIRFEDYSAPQGYCGLYILRFVISNRGESSQSVGISLATKHKIEGTDYTPFALRQEMNNATFGPTKTVAWNSGGSARDIPDAFYIRLPFYSNRLMIATMRAIKYQP